MQSYKMLFNIDLIFHSLKLRLNCQLLKEYTIVFTFKIFQTFEITKTLNRFL